MLCDASTIRRRERIRALLACVAVLAFLVRATPAQATRAAESQPASAPAASRPVGDFSTAGLKRRMRELLPVVQELLGETIPRPVVVAAATRGNLQAASFEESVIAEASVAHPLPPTARRRFCQATAAVLATRVPVKLGLQQGVVFIARETAVALGRAVGDETAFVTQDAVDLVLVMGAVWSWQFKTVGLRALLLSAQTADELACRRAVSDGQALHVARRFAMRQGTTATLDRLVAAMTGPRAPATKAEADSELLTAADLRFQFQIGAAFWECLERGPDAAAARARAFADPPAEVRDVAQPAVWPARLSPPTDAVAVAAALGWAVPWPVRSADAHAMRLSLRAWVLDAAPGTPAEALAQRARAAASARITPSGDAPAGAYVDAYVLVAASDDDASSMFRAARGRNWGWDAADITDGAHTLVERRPFDVPNGEGCVIEATWWRGTAKGDPDRQVIVGRQQELVIVLDAWRVPDTAEALVAVVDKLFAEGAKTRGRASPGSESTSRPTATETRTAVHVITVSGTVRVRGKKAPPATLTVVLWKVGGEQRVVVADGEGGTFQVLLPEGLPCVVGHIWADGVPFDNLCGTVVTASAAEPLALTVGS